MLHNSNFKISQMLHGTVTIQFPAVLSDFYPPASEASRKVANLTERKNLHTHI